MLIIIARLGIAFFATAAFAHVVYGPRTLRAEAYVFSGLFALLGLVYCLTFDEPRRQMIDAGVESYAAPSPSSTWSIAIVFVLVAAQWLLRSRDIESNIDTGAQAALFALAGAVVATWPGWVGWRYRLPWSVVYTVGRVRSRADISAATRAPPHQRRIARRRHRPADAVRRCLLVAAGRLRLLHHRRPAAARRGVRA